MEKASIPMQPLSSSGDVFAAPSASEIDELADRSEVLEQRISRLNDSYETLKKREVELTEWRWVLREAGGFFDRVCFALRGFALDPTDTIARLTATRRKSVNQPTTTKPLYFKMSNSMLRGRMEMHQENDLFPS